MVFPSSIFIVHLAKTTAPCSAYYLYTFIHSLYWESKCSRVFQKYVHSLIPQHPVQRLENCSFSYERTSRLSWTGVPHCLKITSLWLHNVSNKARLALNYISFFTTDIWSNVLGILEWDWTTFWRKWSARHSDLVWELNSVLNVAPQHEFAACMLRR